MAEDKRINVGVDDSGVNKLRQSANELARDMIRSSRAYSTSAKEVLKDLEDQIRAIEKRNKLDAEAARLSIQNRGAAGGITPDQQRSQLGQLARQSQEDKIQTQLLRELIDTVRASAREEIRENRVAVEQTISRDRNVTRLRPQGDAEEILRHTIQRDILGTVGEAETDERNKFRTYGKSAGEGVNQTLSTVASSPNQFYMATALLALIPLIGQGLSAIGGKVVGAADTYGKSMGRLASLRGSSVDTEDANFAGTGALLSGMGLSKSEAADKLYTYQKAAALKMTGSDVVSMMGAERTLGLDTSTVTQLAGIRRYDPMGSRAGDNKFFTNDVSSIVNTLEKGSRENNAILQELVGTYTNTANKILSISGRVDTAGLSSSIVGIKEATGTEGKQLDRVVEGVQGVGQNQSPVIRSMMMRAYREANPEASFFELRAKMERPLEEGNLEATSKMFKRLEEMTGGGENFQNALKLALPNLSLTDITQLKKEGFSEMELKRQRVWDDPRPDRDYSEGTSNVVWKGEEATKRLESIMQDTGKVVVEAIDKSIDKFAELIETLFDKEEDPDINRRQEDMIARAVEAGVRRGMAGKPN